MTTNIKSENIHFCKAIELLEKQETVPTDVHKVMLQVKNQIQNQKEDRFYGFEVNPYLEHITESGKHIVTNECTVVYDRLLQYLNK